MNMTLPGSQYMVKHELGKITNKTHCLVIREASCMVDGILTPLRIDKQKRTTVLWANDHVVARVVFNAMLGIYRSLDENIQDWEVVCEFDLVPKESSDASEFDIT